jgi:hypothetical protein
MHETLPTGRRRSVPLTLVAVLGIALTGCMSTAEQRQANLHEDTGTCADFGSDYGSPEYGQCMLVQQQRRDNKMRDALEQAQISSEIARNNQLMVERMRRKRCDRDPSRKECR